MVAMNSGSNVRQQFVNDVEDDIPVFAQLQTAHFVDFVVDGVQSVRHDLDLCSLVTQTWASSAVERRLDFEDKKINVFPGHFAKFVLYNRENLLNVETSEVVGDEPGKLLAELVISELLTAVEVDRVEDELEFLEVIPVDVDVFDAVCDAALRGYTKLGREVVIECGKQLLDFFDFNALQLGERLVLGSCRECRK